KVILGTTMSLDGFINDRNGSVQSLYPDLEELRKTEMLQESIRTTGAVVMGRHAYDMGEGDFTDYEYQVPIFVLTHHVPEKVAKGEYNGPKNSDSQQFSGEEQDEQVRTRNQTTGAARNCHARAAPSIGKSGQTSRSLCKTIPRPRGVSARLASSTAPGSCP